MPEPAGSKFNPKVSHSLHHDTRKALIDIFSAAQCFPHGTDQQ
jgi:hypothetical protein